MGTFLFSRFGFSGMRVFRVGNREKKTNKMTEPQLNKKKVEKGYRPHDAETTKTRKQPLPSLSPLLSTLSQEN